MGQEWLRGEGEEVCFVWNSEFASGGRVLTLRRVLTSGQWWWKRDGEAECVQLTYAGGARIDALAISGPRHGDQRQRKNLHGTRGCKKIPGAEDQELRVLEARRIRKNTVQKMHVSKPTDRQHPPPAGSL